jgi:hypothetical protein
MVCLLPSRFRLHHLGRGLIIRIVYLEDIAETTANPPRSSALPDSDDFVDEEIGGY